MKVFKFGGASVKDAESVKNVGRILGLFPDDQLVVVISAMGKITNALEKLTDAFYFKKENVQEALNELKKFHFNIIEQLFPDKNHFIYNEINNVFVELDWIIEEEPGHSFDHIYDQIVSLGEIISTKIVSVYLNDVGIKNKWKDARDFIKTDNTYREASVDWSLTKELVQTFFARDQTKNERIIITQGFIGSTSENYHDNTRKGRL
jgi:aspartate kinase